MGYKNRVQFSAHYISRPLQPHVLYLLHGICWWMGQTQLRIQCLMSIFMLHKMEITRANDTFFFIIMLKCTHCLTYSYFPWKGKLQIRIKILAKTHVNRWIKYATLQLLTDATYFESSKSTLLEFYILSELLDVQKCWLKVKGVRQYLSFHPF